MAGPTFESKITLGNWLTIGTMVAAACIAWGTMTTSQATTGAKLDSIAVRQAEMHDKQIETDWRLKNVEKLLADHIAVTDTAAERTRLYEKRH